MGIGYDYAEVVNLRPLFPGQGEIDQVARICELLGDPVEDYGMDDRRRPIGGGRWPRGVQPGVTSRTAWAWRSPLENTRACMHAQVKYT